jgi:hypothetical protein
VVVIVVTATMLVFSAAMLVFSAAWFALCSMILVAAYFTVKSAWKCSIFTSTLTFALVVVVITGIIIAIVIAVVVVVALAIIIVVIVAVVVVVAVVIVVIVVAVVIVVIVVAVAVVIIMIIVASTVVIIIVIAAAMIREVITRFAVTITIAAATFAAATSIAGGSVMVSINYIAASVIHVAVGVDVATAWNTYSLTTWKASAITAATCSIVTDQHNVFWVLFASAVLGGELFLTDASWARLGDAYLAVDIEGLSLLAIVCCFVCFKLVGPVVLHANACSVPIRHIYCLCSLGGSHHIHVVLENTLPEASCSSLSKAVASAESSWEVSQLVFDPQSRNATFVAVRIRGWAIRRAAVATWSSHTKCWPEEWFINAWDIPTFSIATISLATIKASSFASSSSAAASPSLSSFSIAIEEEVNAVVTAVTEWLAQVSEIAVVEAVVAVILVGMAVVIPIIPITPTVTSVIVIIIWIRGRIRRTRRRGARVGITAAGWIAVITVLIAWGSAVAALFAVVVAAVTEGSFLGLVTAGVRLFVVIIAIKAALMVLTLLARTTSTRVLGAVGHVLTLASSLFASRANCFCAFESLSDFF